MSTESAPPPPGENAAELKIDRGFASDCASDRSHRVLRRTVAALARGCGADVI
jgi:EAL domain-containing protein (putative c-di-GMP-specific phosphodiesterase class I)